MNETTNSREPQSEGTDDESLDLRRYLNLVLKRKWLILGTIVAVVAGTAVYTARLPNVYEATATVLIDPAPDAVLGDQVKEVVQLGSGTYWANQEYYNTQYEVVTSHALAHRAVLSYNLHKNEAIVGRLAADPASADAAIARAVGVVRGSMSVRRPKTSRVMRVTIRHKDPKVSAFLANIVVETYIDYSLNRRTEGTGEAAKWLSDELDTAEKSLATSESELVEFQRENGILTVSLEDRQSIVADNISRYTQAVADTRAGRIRLGILLNLLKKAAKDDVLESAIFDLTDNETGPALRSQYYAERTVLVSLEGTLGPKNAEYIAQRKKVEDLRVALEREAAMALDAIDKKYRAAVATEAAFEKELEGYKQEAFDLGPKRVMHNRLARTEKSDEERYSIVLGRLRASDLSSRLKSINIRPLDQAVVPSGAAYPSLRMNVGIAAVLALILGVGLAFLLENLDRTIKTTEQVTLTVGAPVLGIIPIVDSDGGDQDKERDLLVHLHPGSQVAECCRSIRTNLLFSSADKPLKTLTVASAKPREGKTTSVLYLGTIMAQSGQRVLVVDSDMRRPRLHKSMGVSRTAGLSNLILGNVEVDDVVKTTDVPNLFLLPCGPTPPNPAELLTTERFAETLALLESKFDRILLDSPPLLAVTDAAVLARRSDGVILVLRAGRTLRDDATRAGQTLRDVDANIVGVILNELDLEDRSYGYYYNNYYAYGPNEQREASANSAS